MAIKYYRDFEVELKVMEMAKALGMDHVKMDRVLCFRSYGSGSKRLTARCHALPKIWQQALKNEAHYLIEVVSEQYDKQSQEEREKTLIHELLHIPKTFGGGFRHHDYVCHSNVEKFHEDYTRKKGA